MGLYRWIWKKTVMFKSKEQKIAEARAEIEKTFQDFIEGEGRLPEGYSGCRAERAQL